MFFIDSKSDKSSAAEHRVSWLLGDASRKIAYQAELQEWAVRAR
jgi:hypothetical protein